MKKLLSALVLFLIAAAASARGALTIGNLAFYTDESVDSEYFDQNLRVPFKGKIYFDAPNRLIFEDVNMSLQGVVINAEDVEDFTIVLVGENTISGPNTNPIKSNTSLRFEGYDGGSLTITGGWSNGFGLVSLTGGGDLVFQGGTYDFRGSDFALSQNPGEGTAGTLRFEDCTARLVGTQNAVKGFRRVQYEGCGVSSPIGVRYSASGGYQRSASGEAVKDVTIEPAYDLWVGGRLVTHANAYDLTPILIEDGVLRQYDPSLPCTAAYNEYTQTLKLDNAVIFTPDEAAMGGIVSKIEGLTIDCDQLNLVVGSEGHPGLDLGINLGTGQTIIVGEGVLQASGETGVSLSGPLYIAPGAYLIADGQSTGVGGQWRRTTDGTIYYFCDLVVYPGGLLEAVGHDGAVRDIRELPLRDVQILEPVGGTFDPYGHIVLREDGSVADHVLIGSGSSLNPYDLNEDGAVDVSDVTVLVAYVLAPDGSKASAYDLNHDGSVDVSDVTVLVAAVLSGGK